MAISDAGYIGLILAFVFALYAVAASLAGKAWEVGPLVASGRNAAYAVTLLLLGSSAVLAYSFLTHDFGLRYVAQHSSQTMEWYFVASAFYGGQEGSLLYWAAVLSLFATGFLWLNRGRLRDYLPYIVATLMAIEAFFLVVLVFFTNPFQRLPFAMPDGRGLNPILQDPGMLFHPPMLLAGYASWSLPFAISVAALATGKLDAEWIKAVRKPALLAWAVQSTGVLLGAWWAYHVLGWGGYWGWDPVENVSFLPWLLGTAFVHSVMVVERRGKLRAWTLGLVIAAFAASIFGTFVVRSGVLSSVHSFAESEIGLLFLTFFGVVTLATLLLVFWRLPALRDEKEFDSVLSRESGFLVNNLIIVGIAFATFWGTIYPLASEALQGEKITVGPAFYAQVNGPLFLVLVLLMGVGPLLAWRKSSLSALWRNLRIPLLLGAALAALLTLLLGSPVAALAFGASFFALAAVLQEYLRGVQVRRRNTGEAYPEALVTLVSRNRQRYGGYLVHVGIVVLAIGIIASQGFQQQLEVNLQRDETAIVGPYSLTYLGTEESRRPGMDIVSSRLAVTRDGVSFGSAIPRTSYHFNWENQPRSNVAILTSWWDDLYVFQAGVSESSATFAIFVNPLVSWVWAGGTILLLGFLVAAWPERPSARIPVWEPIPGAIAREA